METEANIAWLAGGGEYSRHLFRPGEAQIVPQGTASVEITVTWEENQPGLYGDIELWVKTQAENSQREVAVMESGRMVTLETNASDADLPHQLMSAWEYWIYVRVADNYPRGVVGDLKNHNLHVTIHAEAVRGLELNAFPPHPDHWGNSTERPFIVEASNTTGLWVEEPPGCGFCDRGIHIVNPDDGAIVAPGATAVVVIMEYARATETGLRLLYHGADNREWKDAPIESDSEGRRVHRIPVEQNGDGPYSDQSLWEFYFGFEDGDGPYRGEWSLTASVVKES